MGTAFLTTLEQMARIFLLLAIGFGFNRLRLIPKAAEQVLSKLVTLLLLPCLTLNSNILNCDFQALATYSRWALVGAVCTAISIVCAILLAGRFAGENEYLKGVYRYALAFPNTGGVATPLILAFFGTAGLFQYGMFLFAQGVLCYTWGIMQLQPAQGRNGWRFFLRRILNANFIAMLIGMVLGLLGAKNWMPRIFLGTVEELGSCYVIVALLLTGFSIADYPIRDVVGSWKIFLYSGVRLLVLPCLFLLFMVLIKAPPLLALFAVLSFACPCGMNSVVYPAAYGEDCKTGASMVLISGLISILTIPAMYVLVVAVFGPV